MTRSAHAQEEARANISSTKTYKYEYIIIRTEIWNV